MRESASVAFFTFASVKELAWWRVPVVARRASIAFVLQVVETYWSVGLAGWAFPCLGWCSFLSRR